MNRTMKWIYAALVCILIGAGLMISVGSMNGWDPARFGNSVHLTAQRFPVEEDFGAIDLSEIISEVASSSAAAADAASEGTKARAGEAVRAEAASVPDAGGFGGKCAGASCPASSSTTRSTP